jgi:hypothetical protein
MSKYIIRVNSASEYPQDINMAFVNVDADLLKTIESRRRVFSLAKQEDDSIYSMRYWCGAPDFFESEEMEDELLEGATLAEDPYFTFTPQRIECVTMVVTEEGVSWTCYQKHCDVELRTDILGYVVLEAIS